jgi:uncharacterized membrane protein YkgB
VWQEHIIFNTQDLIGLIVVIMLILSFFGLRKRAMGKISSRSMERKMPLRI